MSNPAAILIPEAILTRKGARTTATVPQEVRQLLDAGRIETANLSEWLVVDQLALAKAVCRDFGWNSALPGIEANLTALEKPTTPKRMAALGKALAAEGLGQHPLEQKLQMLGAHASDIVRSWAGYLIAAMPNLPFASRLPLHLPLAADSNMSVREIAWLSLREALHANLNEALALLRPYSDSPNANIRRFVSELTRPRGVWCRHLEQLKSEPWQALPLLEPLRSDSSKYVRDSVANWLNDAGKSQPTWVKEVCGRWNRESPTKETAGLLKRAMRNF